MTTGAEALAFAPGSAPDLGVFDVRLADMTGWDVCHAIKDCGLCWRMESVLA